MTIGSREHEAKRLQHLVEAGSRVRALGDAERRLLLARLQERIARTALRKKRGWMGSLAVVSALTVGIAVYAPAIVPHREPLQPAAAAHPPEVVAPRSDNARSDATSAAPAEPEPRRISLAGRGEIALDRDAVVSGSPAATGPVSLELRSGRLVADVDPRAADEPLSIVTPQLIVTVVGTRFSVVVAHDLTTVAVEHGKVRVGRSGQTVFVGAGESVRSDDARFVPRPDRVPPPNVPARPKSTLPGVRCDAGERGGACTPHAVRSQGLRAQNALLSRALFERDERRDPDAALASLFEYERRFPTGVLIGEVALTIASTLLQHDRPAQACAYAETFATRFPNDRATLERLRSRCERAVPVPRPVERE